MYLVSLGRTQVQAFPLPTPGAAEQWMLMLSSSMAGTSEKSRNFPFILIMFSLPLSKAHGGTEEKMDSSSKSKATNFNWPKVWVKIFRLREMTHSSQRLSRSLSVHPKDNKAVKLKAVCYSNSWAGGLLGRHEYASLLMLQHASNGQDRAFVILLVVGVWWHSLKNLFPISAVKGRALQSWVGRYAASGSRWTGRASLPHSQADQGRTGSIGAADD